MRAINLDWRPENDINGYYFLRVINLSKEINKKGEVYLTGDWENLHHEFTSKSRVEIVKEIERLYNVQISYPALDKNTIFTGSITHDNLHTALRAVCIPLTFTFEVDGMRVLLKK